MDETFMGFMREVDQSRAAEIAEKPAEQYEQDVRQFVLSGGQVRGDRVRQMQVSLMQAYLKPIYAKTYPLFVQILTAGTGDRDAHQVLADVYAATKDVLASVHLQEWARRTRMLNAVAAEDTNWVIGLLVQQERVEGIVDRMQSESHCSSGSSPNCKRSKVPRRRIGGQKEWKRLGSGSICGIVPGKQEQRSTGLQEK